MWLLPFAERVWNRFASLEESEGIALKHWAKSKYPLHRHVQNIHCVYDTSTSLWPYHTHNIDIHRRTRQGTFKYQLLQSDPLRSQRPLKPPKHPQQGHFGVDPHVATPLESIPLHPPWLSFPFQAIQSAAPTPSSNAHDAQTRPMGLPERTV